MPIPVRKVWARRFATGLYAAISLRSISAAIPRASARFARCALTLARRLASLTAACRPTPRCSLRSPWLSHRLGLLAPALCAALVAVLASLALAGCAGRGLRLGSWPMHLRRRRAPTGGPRPALVPAPVRTRPPTPPAACSARLPAGPSAPPPASSAAAAPLRRVPRRRFPLRSPSDSRLFLRPAAVGSHT